MTAKPSILVPSGCYNRFNIDRVAYKQQTFYFSQFWSLASKSRIKVLADLVSGENPLPHRWLFSHSTFTLWKGRETFGGLSQECYFCKATDLIHEGSFLMTQSPPKGPTSLQYTLGVRIQHMNLWGTQTFRDRTTLSPIVIFMSIKCYLPVNTGYYAEIINIKSVFFLFILILSSIFQNFKDRHIFQNRLITISSFFVRFVCDFLRYWFNDIITKTFSQDHIY